MDLHEKVSAELTLKFGDLKIYDRTPAQYRRVNMMGSVEDDTVAYEVRVRELDEVWWSCYRYLLERRFAQQDVVMRTQRMGNEISMLA